MTCSPPYRKPLSAQLSHACFSSVEPSALLLLAASLPTTYTIVWSLALANVLGAGLCLGLSPAIARLTTIRFPVLAPFMLMMITFAAFQSKQTLWDLMAIGLLGVYMKRFDWPRPAFLIGFVLADQAEVYTYQATQFTMIKGLGYLFSPTVAILAVIIVVSVWLGARESKQIERGPEKGGAAARHRTPQLVFAGLVTAFLAVAFIDALQVAVLIDRVFPMVVSGFTLAGAIVVMARLKFAGPAAAVLHDDEAHDDKAKEADPPDSGMYPVWRPVAWLLGLVALTAVTGFIIAVTAYFLVFLRIRARQTWLRAAVMTVCGVAAVLGLANMLHRDFPPGLLQEFFLLPWPFR